MAILNRKTGNILNSFTFLRSIKNNLIKVICLFLILMIPMKTFSDTGTVLSRASGGVNGTPFVEMVAPGGVISKITIRSGKYIDSIQLTYQYKHPAIGKKYGGNGGVSTSFTLRRGEYITELGGRSGKYIDSIYVKTNKGRTKQWGGNGGSKKFSFTGTKNLPIQGIWGRSGSLIDAIGVVKKSNGSQGSAVKKKLKAFKPTPHRTALEKDDCDKCDSLTNPVFPTIKDSEFWKKQNDRLYRLIQRLSISPNEFSSYISQIEYQHCNGHMYCEIDTRTDLLLEVLK